MPVRGVRARFLQAVGPLVVAFLCSAAVAQTPLPAPQGRVDDFAHVLSERDRARLQGVSDGLDRQTSAELFIVTVPTLGGESIGDYAYRLGNAWGVGKRGKNNGVVLLLAVQEQQAYIAVGAGLGSVLTSDVCTQIAQRLILPSCQPGRYGDGLSAGAQQIARTIVQASAPPPTPAPSSTYTPFGYSRYSRYPGDYAISLFWAALVVGGLVWRIVRWAIGFRHPWRGFDDDGWRWGSRGGWGWGLGSGWFSGGWW